MTAEQSPAAADPDVRPGASDCQGRALRVTVTVNTDELRAWAEKHADAGHHGVAHVLYQAAAGAESLTEQTIAQAEARGARAERERIVDALRAKFGVTNRAADFLARAEGVEVPRG